VAFFIGAGMLLEVWINKKIKGIFLDFIARAIDFLTSYEL
jgi:hypothetical protein